MTIQINTNIQGEVVISYKDIKLSLWINTETQYDNIKFAQLIVLSQCYRFQQTENLFFFLNVKQHLNCTFF